MGDSRSSLIINGVRQMRSVAFVPDVKASAATISFSTHAVTAPVLDCLSPSSSSSSSSSRTVTINHNVQSSSPIIRWRRPRPSTPMVRIRHEISQHNVTSPANLESIRNNPEVSTAGRRLPVANNALVVPPPVAVPTTPPSTRNTAVAPVISYNSPHRSPAVQIPPVQVLRQKVKVTPRYARHTFNTAYARQASEETSLASAGQAWAASLRKYAPPVVRHSAADDRQANAGCNVPDNARRRLFRGG